MGREASEEAALPGAMLLEMVCAADRGDPMKKGSCPMAACEVKWTSEYVTGRLVRAELSNEMPRDESGPVEVAGEGASCG